MTCAYLQQSSRKPVLHANNTVSIAFIGGQLYWDYTNRGISHLDSREVGINSIPLMCFYFQCTAGSSIIISIWIVDITTLILAIQVHLSGELVT